MLIQGIAPRLADGLRSLAENQLQAQASRSAALDGGALGMIAVDVAVATVVLDAQYAYLWVIALAMIGLSLGLAVRALRLPGAKGTGPSVVDTLQARVVQTDRQLEALLLEGLAEDVNANERALVSKASLFDRALIFLVLAIVIELAGDLY